VSSFDTASSDARFLLVTVTDASHRSRDRVNVLLESLAKQPALIELVLVMRGGGARPGVHAGNLRVHALDSAQQVSLSRARNGALAYARAEGLLDGAHIVAFPDDDCSYPPDLLARVAASLDAGVEIVVGRYGPDLSVVDHTRFPSEDRALTPPLTMQTVSSNNIFFSAQVVTEVGDFDERLGLGAPYGAAEDTDYVLRALRLGAHGVYRAEVFVAHPYKPHRASEYYVGNVAVEAKHALRGGTFVRLARRLGSGPVLALRRTITLRDFARALAAAGRLLRASSPDQSCSSERTR
jgi:hypothetical protein